MGWHRLICSWQAREPTAVSAIVDAASGPALRSQFPLFDCDAVQAALERVLPGRQPDAERARKLAAVEPCIARPRRRSRPLGQRDGLDFRDAVTAQGPAGKDRLGKAEPGGLAGAGDVVDAGAGTGWVGCHP